MEVRSVDIIAFRGGDGNGAGTMRIDYSQKSSSAHEQMGRSPLLLFLLLKTLLQESREIFKKSLPQFPLRRYTPKSAVGSA